MLTSPPNMRVLHIGKFYPPHKGGMESHLQQLCTSLHCDIEVSVVVSSDTRSTIREVIDGINVTRVGTLCVARSAPICPGMAAAIRSTPADIVHLHHPNPAGVLAYLASGHTGKLVVSYISDIIRQRLLTRFFDPILHSIMRRASAVVSLSPNYIESSPILSLYRDKTHCIPHGIPLQDFSVRDADAIAGIRHRFRKPIILGVGRMVYYKGFEYLIRAMSHVNADLLLIGNGPLRSELMRVAQECGASSRVHFLGEVPDVRPYYHACDIFTLPSIARSEAFGIVQQEAMACGKPVVNTQLDSGVPYVSIGGTTGLTVPPMSVEALSEALNLLLENPNLRARYGEAARRRVMEEFTLETMSRRTLDLYRHVLAIPRPILVPTQV